MTLIECFDKSMVKNISGCLHLNPEKVIFLGDADKMQLPLRRIQNFLDAQGFCVQIISQDVQMDHITHIANLLREVLQQESACVIDVTGGDERMMIAMGMVFAELDAPARNKIVLQKFDPSSSAVLYRNLEGKLLAEHKLSLRVADLIALHAGVLHPASPQPDASHSPRDLDPLWNLARRDPKLWNRQLAILAEFESRSDSKTHIILPLHLIRSGIANFTEKLDTLQDLLRYFRENGIIRDQSHGDFLEYQYTSELNRHCTLKAGNILETKVLLEARAVQENGAAVFHDCQLGAHIDWDGVIHDNLSQIPETRNEIDLILIKGIVPLFISCKNGDVDEHELYKLSAVADQFGGPFAKKLLVATRLQKKNPLSYQAFVQRAKDMGIYLIENGADLTPTQWQEQLQAATM